MRVMIVGTVGIPAAYGGFETLAENLVRNVDLAERMLEMHVFCSGIDGVLVEDCPLPAKLIRIPLRANGVQSVLYDGVSLIISLLRRADVIVLLGVSGAIFLPLVRLFSSVKIVVNVDGIESRRSKWKGFARAFLKFSERVAVRFSDSVVADNLAISRYLLSEYGCSSETIAYGGDHVLEHLEVDPGYLNDFPNFGFSLCRIEPENNVHITLEAIAQLPGQNFIFVGNWSGSEYGRELRKKYENCSWMMLLDPIYELGVLRWMRARACFYVHGHSAGGTNPSLVEMMFFDVPLLCFDCDFNRITTNEHAFFFSSANELLDVLVGLKSGGCRRQIAEARKFAGIHYRWDVIARRYFQIFWN